MKFSDYFGQNLSEPSTYWSLDPYVMNQMLKTIDKITVESN